MLFRPEEFFINHHTTTTITLHTKLLKEFSHFFKISGFIKFNDLFFKFLLRACYPMALSTLIDHLYIMSIANSSNIFRVQIPALPPIILTLDELFENLPSSMVAPSIKNFWSKQGNYQGRGSDHGESG
jgi:hypothetical protein